MTEGLLHRAASSLRRLDPAAHALHKALKTAVIVPIALGIGVALGDPAFSVFAAFGAVALLLFADFPGSSQARLTAYVGLALVGALLIVLGTVTSSPAWLAVATMAVIGFVIWFSGVLSAALAGATRALLLAFVLAVTVPGSVSDLGPRLGGWALAVALSVPVAVWVWPPRDHDRLRRCASELCAALSGLLSSQAPSDPAAVDAAAEAFLHEFESTTTRPVGLTTGSRVLLGLVARLGWVRSVAVQIPADARELWPEDAVRLLEGSAAALAACARVLERADPESRAVLATAVAELEAQRTDPALFSHVLSVADTGTVDRGTAPAVRRSILHELAYTTQLVGEVVEAAGAADSRQLLHRVLGIGLTALGEGRGVAHQAARHLTPRSVWFQNSVRAAVGLALAVGLVAVTEAQHGFWVVLGTMSVLRTTAITTRGTALRALVGTVLGFAVGAAILAVIGTEPWHLWVVLPFAILIAAYLPEVVSFVAGQAAFTVWVVIQFNLIAPDGWTVGLVRVEDVAMGCLVGLVSGVLLWPHGAAGQLVDNLAEAFRVAAGSFAAATDRVVSTSVSVADLTASLEAGRAGHARLDDALRQYLAERGAKPVPLLDLTALSNAAGRVLLAAETLADIDRHPVPASSDRTTDLVLASTGLSDSTRAAAHWYRRLSDCLLDPAKSLPEPAEAAAEPAVVTALGARRSPAELADLAEHGDARRIWATSLYTDDVVRMQARTTGPAAALSIALGSPRVTRSVAGSHEA